MAGRAELDRDVPTVWRMLSTGRMADKGGKCRHNGKHGGIRRIKTMMEQILEPENLSRAWPRVKTNAGAPGIDGMSIEAFPDFNREHWPRICSALMDGTYRPAPVRRVFIPKPDGSQRPLGVPTVLDRVIQQALAQVLTPLFESGFSEHSYGFRENRSAHQAVRQMESCWKEGRRHAVDCDLKSFFDTVNHDRLMGQLREKIHDRKVLGLIRRYLEAGGGAARWHPRGHGSRGAAGRAAVTLAGQYHARPTGQGTRTSRASLCPLRGRLSGDGQECEGG